MTTSFRLVLFLCLLACGSVRTVSASVNSKDGVEQFERYVRPLFVEQCIKCHGPDEQENGLRLDSRAALLDGGGRGPAIDLADPIESLLLLALSYEDCDMQMPPSGKLDATTIKRVKAWIELGAPWTESPEDSDPSSPAVDEQPGESHWSLQPVRKPERPKVTSTDWPRNDIDRFVLARQEASDLTPASPAEPRVLIRRAYFDLTGLPPTYEEVRAFEADPSEEAYARVIDGLLNRQAYGEHWGRHWLDVARYADTTGYQEGAQLRFPFAHTYRDYVVRSFNEDTPFDQFVIEQLAADKIPLAPDERWKLAGMGFLTVGPRFNYNRHEIIDDRIDVTTRGFLGLGVICARCHDHKYDPMTSADYYGLYGIFASSREPLYPFLPRVGPGSGDIHRYLQFQNVVRFRRSRFEEFLVSRRREIQIELRTFAGDYLQYLVQTHPLHRTQPQVSLEMERTYLRGPTPYGPGAIVRWKHYLETVDSDDPVFGLWKQLIELPPEEFATQARSLVAGTTGGNSIVKRKLLESDLNEMRDVARVYGRLLEAAYQRFLHLTEENPNSTALEDAQWEQLRQVLYSASSPVSFNQREAYDVYSDAEFNEFMGLKRELDSAFVEFHDVSAPRAMILIDRDEVVEPRLFARGDPTRPGKFVARALPSLFARLDFEQPGESVSGRLQLARSIASSKNPLTARVIVNRVWQWHFGRGLVATPSDFGVRGARPTHPDLLDYLADSLVSDGWSLKQLHRRIMLSATYKQSSLKAALTADPENRLLARAVTRRLSFESLRDSMLAVSGQLDHSLGGPSVEDLQSNRRSIYLTIDRTDLNTTYVTFDFPSPDILVGRRAETTVPQQALFLMNHEFTNRVAEQMVEEMHADLHEASSDERIAWLYRRTLGRDPLGKERELMKDYVQAATEEKSADSAVNNEVWWQLSHALLMSNEFCFVD